MATSESVWLLNLAPTTIILVWRKILKLDGFFEQIQKLTKHYVNYDILVQNNHGLNSNMKKLASSPFYACVTRIDDFFTFRRNFWIFLFVFVN